MTSPTPTHATADESTPIPTLGRASSRRRRVDMVGILGPLVAFGLFIGFWYVMHYWALEAVFAKPGFLISAPHRVVNESYLDSARRADMLRGLGWTSLVAMTGLSIAIVVGMTLAILMAQANWIERSVWPFLIAGQAIPILTVVPIIGAIFGYGFAPRIFVCVVISIFPIVANTLFGLLSADRPMHDLFTLHGASRWTRLRKLQLPAALPAIFSGFRIAAGLSVIGALVGELFFRRGNKGIGILMEVYRSRSLYPPTYGALILSSLLGVAVFLVFGWLGRAVTGKWHESNRQTG